VVIIHHVRWLFEDKSWGQRFALTGDWTPVSHSHELQLHIITWKKFLPFIMFSCFVVIPFVGLWIVVDPLAKSCFNFIFAFDFLAICLPTFNSVAGGFFWQFIPFRTKLTIQTECLCQTNCSENKKWQWESYLLYVSHLLHLFFGRLWRWRWRSSIRREWRR